MFGEGTFGEVTFGESSNVIIIILYRKEVHVGPNS
jgi:hypothetical protein